MSSVFAASISLAGTALGWYGVNTKHVVNVLRVEVWRCRARSLVKLSWRSALDAAAWFEVVST